MARKRRKSEAPAPELPMTPMIDVVFQLLIYFLVTIQPRDVLAHLDVFRPSPDQRQQEQQEKPKMIRILVFPDGYTINDRPVDVSELDRLLTRLAGIDRNQTILITCTAASQHERLVRVLDLCAKNRLVNLSVVSTY
ncbi:MAG: biopolymer transport protein ExbD [Verrucomicrobia bacterium ADurb.Bin345]|nr:MAG: biopolymer transport protein ExbD [Verrucomicrobia bacterium ADurb.Bin345]